MRRFLLCEVAAALLVAACGSGDGGTSGQGVTGESAGTGSSASGGVGATGTSSGASLSGSAGASGGGGSTGTGTTGASTGSTGSQTGGATAASGATGAAGSPGASGTASTSGMSGATGTSGTTGTTGSPTSGATGTSASSGTSIVADGGPDATGGSLDAGTGSSGNCNVSPVDPSATTQVKNELCYLYSIYGNHVLSGQQETSWSNPQSDIDYYVKTVGKYPAILGGDYLYPSGTTSRAQAYWAAGGLTMMRFHMGAPPLSDTYPNSQMSTNYANVLTSGTTENKSLLSKLDYLAGELQTLQNAKVAVIMALFHEVQANGWFWWAKGTGAQFVQLWQLAFKYLTVTKGIHNVIWLLPFSGSPNSAYYPGKAYVDLCGPDEYDTPGNQPFSGYYKKTSSIVGSTLPIPLHETGAIPQPSNMFPSTAPWLLWNIWATYENAPQSGVTYNTTSSIQSAYSSPYTITRDKLPKF